MQGANAGTQNISNQTDIAIGTSATPIRVFYAESVSGGTAATVILRNGTSGTATAFSQIDGVINKSASRYYGPDGMYFPAGCFADVDANTTYLTVVYKQEVL